MGHFKGYFEGTKTFLTPKDIKTALKLCNLTRGFLLEALIEILNDIS